jgi:2-polyprenyl-3-methyl-5-hydroxy-6-metoxy-1,4-benzoquinol methylase
MNKCVVCTNTDFTILFTRPDGRKMGKCASCGLVQVVPMPSSNEIAALYHEDFDHFTPYIEQLPVHHAYFRQKIHEIGNYLPGKTLLDIGCAMGVMLEEAGMKGMKATGIDLSQDAVNYCNKHKLMAYHGTVYTAKKLQNKTFDVITAFQIIEHERDPLGMMRRVHKLLNKGGMVVLATPNYGGLWRKLMGKRWFGFTHPEHVVLLDPSSMRTLLEKSGFRDIEIRSDSPRPFPLSFAFTRGADYFPWMAWLLKPIGKLLDGLKIINPINPWDDMIAFAKK